MSFQYVTGSPYKFITFTIRNCVRFFHEGESEGGKTRAYRLPACHVSKKWRCMFVRSRARARVNKVKHLSRVNGNINTPRRLRLETSRANERGTKDFAAAGREAGALRSAEGQRVRGRFSCRRKRPKVEDSRW